MQLLLRALLIWLLALAVPVQGAAAVTMASCGPKHHESVVGAQAQSARSEKHAHPQGNALHAPKHQHADAATAGHGADAAVPVTVSKKVHDGKHKCSACASCCSAAALPGTVLAVFSPDIATTVFADHVAAIEALAPDGPDRPPRNVLA